MSFDDIGGGGGGGRSAYQRLSTVAEDDAASSESLLAPVVSATRDIASTVAKIRTRLNKGGTLNEMEGAQIKNLLQETMKMAHGTSSRLKFLKRDIGTLQDQKRVTGVDREFQRTLRDLGTVTEQAKKALSETSRKSHLGDASPLAPPGEEGDESEGGILARPKTAQEVQYQINQSELERREESIRNIDQELRDVAEIYRDLGLMLSEQRENLEQMTATCRTRSITWITGT